MGTFLNRSSCGVRDGHDVSLPGDTEWSDACRMPTTGEDVVRGGLYAADCPRHRREPKTKARLEVAEVFPPCPTRGCGEIVVWTLLVEMAPGDH
jgi:hypothetical protein